ncbi:MAG: hypothetical protein DCC58_00300 [Chloroflexi bacterium]|nr:MAG: hypothetical protein DCC58_00300 [Chloroflexota bacterium]
MSTAGLRVAIVGGCAAGKSTLARALRARGIDAWPVAQEHSIIADLWRHQSPDVLVLLDASLEVVRSRRRDATWPRFLWELQQLRLADARAHADILICTDTLDCVQVTENVLDQLAVQTARAAERDTP